MKGVELRRLKAMPTFGMAFITIRFLVVSTVISPGENLIHHCWNVPTS